ncbi:MAG: C1 family peptidase [Bacteroidota bacterium]
MKKSILFFGALFAFSSFMAQVRTTGLEFNKDKMKAAFSLIEKPLGFGANLPRKFSLERFVPSIGDQGNYGSCTGWSTTYYAATISYNILAERAGLPFGRDMFAFDPMFTYQQIKFTDANDCSEGTYIEDALVYFMEHGAKRKMIDEANCGWIPQWQNTVWKATGAWYLWDDYDNDITKIEAVCQMISEGNPVPFGMLVPESFFNVGADGLFKPKADEDTYGGHAMTVVGYDDDKFGGAFRVVNSWGTSWGDKGFCWIKYEDFIRFVYNTYHFDAELEGVDNSIAAGTVFGVTATGFGIQKIPGKKGSVGFFEGFFENGVPTKGLYFNSSKIKGGKAGIKFMEKLIKKNGGFLIYDNDDIPIGCIIF